MALRLGSFADVGLDEASLELVIDEFTRGPLPRLDRLWTYYRNPLKQSIGGAAGRWYRQAQEAGLPPRITARGAASALDDRSSRREIVIENDIGWRVHAMIDFLLGKPVKLRSRAADPDLAAIIERTLEHVWDRAGGIALLQDAALLGHVFGHVDFIVRAEPGLAPTARPAPEGPHLARALHGAELLRIEVVDPRRGIPVMNKADYRSLDAYVIRTESAQPAPRGPIAGLLDRLRAPRPASPGTIEVISGSAWHIYEGESALWRQDRLPFGGEIPVAHVQNMAQPFQYEGLSEVEPLIPLQDELNTRLSDRANRITFQAFKMYLAKGVPGFEKGPVGPGAIWSTDNPDASIQSFGGDAESPGELAHIAEIRDALDKVSGVPPLASGVVQAKIGNLSSANALRITLMGVLSKTARKRITYGAAIERVCRLVLRALDAAGALPTSPEDRAVRLEWPDPLPVDIRDEIALADAKQRLGSAPTQVLDQLTGTGSEPDIG